MEFFTEYWYIILALLLFVALVIIAIVKFAKLPTKEQLGKLTEWLLYAVTEAERELGSGTGKLKLRQVYDLFVVRFPWLARVLSFTRFAELVDDALEEMRGMLQTNPALKAYVEGEANA